MFGGFSSERIATKIAERGKCSLEKGKCVISPNPTSFLLSKDKNLVLERKKNAHYRRELHNWFFFQDMNGQLELVTVN